MLTREYPPEVYGGAGVHVGFLVPELRRLVDVDVFCFGAPRADATAVAVPAELADANFALSALGVDLVMAQAAADCDVVHSHTWYANLGGHLAGLLGDIPHVLTAHSLEPRRPWKLEQLGEGYRVSSWAEATAYAGADAVIAVSDGMAADILDAYPFLDPARLHVVRNGIDTDLFHPVAEAGAARRLGLDPERPYVLFVGRITRQKGLDLLLAAAADFDPAAQLLVCAGSPDTPAIGQDTADAVTALQAHRDGVVWVSEPVPRADLVELLSGAAVFVCPSVYEPLGIVNLEAMACETPVVATAVGGIPEVVDDGVTGLLVGYDAADPAATVAGLAAAVNALVADPERAGAMGRAGRARAVQEFGWPALAAATVAVYQTVLAAR